MDVGLRPGAKAPEAPPMPYRPRASPRLYTNLVSTLITTAWRSRSAPRCSPSIPGRAFVRGPRVLDALHVPPLLERKHRAVPEARRFSAAGPGVAPGAGRARQAHAQARPGMGPDAAADGDAPARDR